ncbi:hypothetical protein NVP1003O_58 [Vibrio phage 1.003.O._10N.286.48.A2]|nr:hypothetical protein NVP1003O_58 [Vibrio phage 1.003.O._10N.286.48.A2]
MWTLILTITLTGGVYGGVSSEIHHVKGFESEIACREFGGLWLGTTSGSGSKKSAICGKMN